MIKPGWRYLLVAGGTLCVVLAILGVLLPVLPTTPFLLLAAALYARSSPRFYRWLLHNRLFGRYLDDYRAGRGIALWHKIISLTLLWGTIGLTTALAVQSWWLRGLLLAVALGVTWHLLRVPTRRPQG